MNPNTKSVHVGQLPGLDCGMCGFRKCADLAAELNTHPDWLKRCIQLSHDRAPCAVDASACRDGCGVGHAAFCAAHSLSDHSGDSSAAPDAWVDSLGRDFAFYLEHFPEDPGPREIIIPHNPMLTRELEIAVGDVLIGRPLGMSCGCPITHCGIATAVDARTGVITWCVTGPLGPREKGFKDIGYYIAEAYEGLVRATSCLLQVGARYYFQPRMCMLQWRHSGLVNYLNRLPDGYQVRLEGLFIG